MASLPAENNGAPSQGLTRLFSSNVSCLGLLILALGCMQVGVIRVYEAEYFTFYKDLIESFFRFGIRHIEGWFAFLAIFGPMIAAIVVLLDFGMTSKARAAVVFLGALSTWGWVVYFLVNSEYYEGTNWFGESLRQNFASETDAWGSVGNWIFLALLVLSIAHLLAPTAPTQRSA